MKQFIALLLGTILSVGAVHAQDAAYRYEKGKEYKYLIEQTGLTMQEMPGQTVTVNSESTIRAVYTVIETKADGSMKMQTTIENALAINENPNGTKTFGEDMAGKSAQFDLDPSGDVMDIDSSIRQIDGEGIQLLLMATDIFPTLDPTKLAVGENWSTTDSDTTHRSGEIITNTEKEFNAVGTKSVDGMECLEIEVKTSSEVEGKMVNGEQELMLTGSSDGKGTILYALKEGILVSHVSEHTMDQTIVFPANNMRIPITSTMNIKIGLSDK